MDSLFFYSGSEKIKEDGEERLEESKNKGNCCGIAYPRNSEAISIKSHQFGCL